MTGHSSVVGRILAWLRSGYPEGVPQDDYVALFGILRRSCTPQEIETIAHELHSEALSDGSDGDRVIDDETIRARIRHHLHQTPEAEDIRRVAARLAAGGWPLVEGSGMRDGAAETAADAPTAPTS